MVVETHYARSGDVRIAYQVVGGGSLDLVFVPGFISNLDHYWDEPTMAHFLNRLGSFSRLVMFDMRGHGLSYRPGRPPTLEESMSDVHPVLDAADSERAALVGIAEGGPMCELFAASHPERTRALVLYGTYSRLLRAPDYPAGLPPEVLDEWAVIIQRDWGGPALPRTLSALFGRRARAARHPVLA